MSPNSPSRPASDDVVARVKAATDLVEVVHAFVPLRRRGRHFEGLCPFHEEKTPSFKVQPEGQFFKCFGCGKGGDCFSFVEEMERVSFREALEILADRAGIQLRSGAMGAGGEREGMREALRFAEARFRANLASPRGREARAYLERRGISAATAEAFGLGLAAEGWDDLIVSARAKGLGVEALEAAGLVVRNDEGRVYDRFRGRLVFPIYDGLDRAVGFGGRVLRDDDKPKYLNSPESPLFSKGRLLYALERTRRSAAPAATSGAGGPLPLAVVEGYTDVILPHQEGVRNVVATLGTALTPEHARALSRHTGTVVLVFDSDEAGLRASARGVEVLLAEDLDVRVAVVPEGKDPCDFVRARGGPAFQALLDGAADFFERALDRASKREDAASAAGKARVVDELLGLVVRIPSPVRRAEYAKRIARALLVSEAALDRRLEALRARAEGSSLRRAGAEAAPPPAAAAPDARRRAEEDCLASCVLDPGAFPAVRHAVDESDFADPWNVEIFRAMLDLDRRGEEIEGGRLLTALAGRPSRARLAEWLGRPSERLAAALHGSLDFLQRARLDRDVDACAEAYRRARTASDATAEREALQSLHTRLREAKTLGR